VQLYTNSAVVNGFLQLKNQIFALEMWSLCRKSMILSSKCSTAFGGSERDAGYAVLKVLWKCTANRTYILHPRFKSCPILKDRLMKISMLILMVQLYGTLCW